MNALITVYYGFLTMLRTIAGIFLPIFRNAADFRGWPTWLKLLLQFIVIAAHLCRPILLATLDGVDEQSLQRIAGLAAVLSAVALSAWSSPSPGSRQVCGACCVPTLRPRSLPTLPKHGATSSSDSKAKG